MHFEFNIIMNKSYITVLVEFVLMAPTYNIMKEKSYGCIKKTQGNLFSAIEKKEVISEIFVVVPRCQFNTDKFQLISFTVASF